MLFWQQHSWFHSSHAEQLMDLLARVKPPTDTKTLTSRFAFYKTLLIDALQVGYPLWPFILRTIHSTTNTTVMLIVG